MSTLIMHPVPALMVILAAIGVDWAVGATGSRSVQCWRDRIVVGLAWAGLWALLGEAWAAKAVRGLLTAWSVDPGGRFVAAIVTLAALLRVGMLLAVLWAPPPLASGDSTGDPIADIRSVPGRGSRAGALAKWAAARAPRRVNLVLWSWTAQAVALAAVAPVVHPVWAVPGRVLGGVGAVTLNRQFGGPEVSGPGAWWVCVVLAVAVWAVAFGARPDVALSRWAGLSWAVAGWTRRAGAGIAAAGQKTAAELPLAGPVGEPRVESVADGAVWIDSGTTGFVPTRSPALGKQRLPWWRAMWSWAPDVETVLAVDTRRRENRDAWIVRNLQAGVRTADIVRDGIATFGGSQRHWMRMVSQLRHRHRLH